MSFLTALRTAAARAIAPPLAPPSDERKSWRASPFVTFDGPRSPVWAPRDATAFAREGYMQNAIAYRAVRLIAEAAGSVPLLVYDGDTELDAHPLIDVLRSPHSTATTSDVIAHLVSSLLVSGNAYVEVIADNSGALRELHILRADRMRIVPGPDGWPDAYDYSLDGRVTRIAGDAAPGVPRILHLKLWHPLDDHYGLSPLEAAASAIDLHNTASAWNKALLDNSARPSGALVYAARDGSSLTGEQYERLKRELETGFQGAGNAGRPLLLEGGLDWKAMSLSPRDLDFLESRNAAAREIALAVGVPPQLLGIPGDATYSNYQEANRALWRHTVLPLVHRITAAFSSWLGASFAPALAVRPDLDAVDALTPDRDATWKRLDRTTFLTPNEKRAAAGYGPLADGNLLNFSPDQPRNPAGSGRQCGRWTRNPTGGGGGSGGGATETSDPEASGSDTEVAFPEATVEPVWFDGTETGTSALGSLRDGSDEYSPDRRGWHDYSAGPTVVCEARWNCSREEMADYLSRHAVPGRPSDVPVKNGEYTLVFDPTTGAPGGWVRTYVTEEGLTARNITTRSHVLFDGQVTRRVNREGDGTWYISTRGTGNNVIPGIATINQWLGPGVFNALDRNMYAYIKRRKE